MTKEEYNNGLERLKNLERDSPEYEKLLGDLTFYFYSNGIKRASISKQVPIIE